MILDKVDLHHVRAILGKVNAWAPKMRKMSDAELRNQTNLLRDQLKGGKTVDDVLPQAFATIREADYRILGMFPYDVQVMGAIILNQGYIAEMKTGEGKTLMATMAIYLNALEGKGSMLVTPNGYLASRDEAQLAPVYEWLGMTVSLGFDEKIKHPKPALKRKWYNADITYTTASTLAFDYLFNNLADSLEDQYMRPLNFVVIDEVDAVLLDGANSPFVVASTPGLLSNLYPLADNFVRILKPEKDIKFDRPAKGVWLTYEGVKKAESYFRIKDLYGPQNRELYRHIALALRAHYYMHNGRDYLVKDGKVQLLDEANGRLMKGMKLNTGLHQAMEQKEHVKVTPNQATAASITYPSLFSLFNKTSGMSGTAKVDENEFINVYNMKVIPVPTHKPVIRKDLPSRVFLTTHEKLLAAINLALKLHNEGRPILLVAGSVENSEIVSELLLDKGIPHNVLNAFNAAREADIVKDAGQAGAVTIATNMAGRGTDIRLGPGVKEKGGLAVIGTEMLPERVRLQLAGRAGRQGDPGSSQFFISLEDSFISKASTKRFKKYYRKMMRRRANGEPAHELRNPRLKLSLALLASRVADSKELGREQTNKYEIAMRIQRNHLYEERQRIMKITGLKDAAIDWLAEGINLYLDSYPHLTTKELKKFVTEHISYKIIDIPDNLVDDRTKTVNYLKGLCRQILDQKTKILLNDKQVNQFYRAAMLKALDTCWIQEVSYLSDLRTIVAPMGKAQRDPGYIYQVKALHSYKKMLEDSRKKMVDNLMLSEIMLIKGKMFVWFV
jgi:preprotein translocase subunit SecA